jgi:hypothetical protein
MSILVSLFLSSIGGNSTKFQVRSGIAGYHNYAEMRLEVSRVIGILYSPLKEAVYP